MTELTASFDPDCKRCARLTTFLQQGKQEYPQYHCAPVAPFGDADARLIIVGLAPGFHGANASGRPFTGDYAGIVAVQARKSGMEPSRVQVHRDKKALADWVISLVARKKIGKDDWLLIKGSRGMRMEQVLQILIEQLNTTVN